jgi:hypothetical protein
MPPWWSTDEDWLLRQLYEQGAPLRAIAARVGRSPDAVSERRRALGIASRQRSRPWSPLEDQLLQAGSARGVPAALIARRLGRPPEQVRQRRRALMGAGRAGRPYRAAEDDAIAACWAKGGDVEDLARLLGRSAGSIRLRAQKLGLHRPSPRARWRAYEDAAVRDGYEHGLTCAQIAAELHTRTPAAVAARAAKLGLATHARAWTPYEDRVLRQLAHRGTELEHAAQLLWRTPQSLRARARKLRIAPPPPRHARRTGGRWTSAEDELLRLYGARNPAALAELLDRSAEAITKRLRVLGLRDGAQRSPHHPVPARSGLTPGQRTAVTRELPAGGLRRRLALAQRLGLEPADARRLEDLAGRPGAGPAPRSLRGASAAPRH